MPAQDARCLSADAQEALRFRVMQALRSGMKPAVAARTFGVSRSSVWNWRRQLALGNLHSLKSKPRGRPRRPRLKSHQAASAVRLITDRCPDQLKLPFALWTRGAVRHLLAQRFGVQLSERTVGRYLANWGLTPQKPLRRAYERDPQAVKRWLQEQYPGIRAQARAEKAEIHWGDELGLRCDHQAGRSYGRRGQTPVIPGTGQRFRCSQISSVTKRGDLSFMVFKERCTAGVFIRFLRRLLKQRKRKVFLIMGRHAVHRAQKATDWLNQQRQRLRLFFLPGYSPDLNPDEYLNQDVKTNAVGRRRPTSRDEVIANVRGYLWSTQRQPELVRSYFQHESVAYAAL